MFRDFSMRLLHNAPHLGYGMAVFDADGDGAFEVAVAGFGDANLLLKWQGTAFENVANERLADPDRQSISVAAGDLDGDGREELYVLNTDTFAGAKHFTDRLFDVQDGQWIDLFSLDENAAELNLTAGRSVCVIDRLGTGRYGFFVANYGGPMLLYELNERGLLEDVAARLHINAVTGGRSLLSLPLMGERMDLFAGNERGANFLLRNRGDGTFEDVARPLGLADPHQHARGVAALDGGDHFGLALGNWEGPNRLFLRIGERFDDVAPPEMARPGRVRNVIAADFDNDGYEELFFHHIGEPNRLFAQREGQWQQIAAGDATEPTGMGTGAAVGDFDGDGRLELLLSHGEATRQPLSCHRTAENGHHFLRVLPLTRYGAPARGAVVLLETAGRTQRRAIDAGSGYLCQMEPVAHFGLGHVQRVDRVVVRFPEGTTVVREDPQVNTQITLRATEG